MGCHAVDLLLFSVKLDRLTTIFFASIAGFFFFMWPLCSILLVVLFEVFLVLHGLTGSMQHVFFHLLIICSDGLHNFSCACQCGPSWGCLARRILLPYILCHKCMVVICPNGGFRRYSSFVDLIGDFHKPKSITGLLVGLTFEVPSL